MKKIFPIIFILISLSLAGTIYVQYSWLDTMLVNKQEEFKWKVTRIIDNVGRELMEQKNTLPSLKNYHMKPGFNFPSDQFQRELMRPATIGQKFTAFEVEEKLRKAFNEQGLRNIDFDFAVIADVGSFSYEYQLRSDNFLKAFEDTINNFQWVLPLQPPSGSDLENLTPAQEMILIIPDIRAIAFKQMRWMIIGSIFFTLMIVSAFYVTVSALLRQKKISEIKNDFINNMTHEFKTPLATISLAVDALRNNKVMDDRSKMNYFSGIIKEENKRMNKHVETILQAALMDRQEIQLNKKPIHLHELIREVTGNYSLQLEEKQGRIDLQLHAANDYINADEVHFRNLISNLVDNAVKYSKENLTLKISSSNSGSRLILKFEDNGIGMSKETLRRIFEKFYRAHTGNLHNVKGFGLGLSYVKTVIDAHDGKIKVDSSVGRGSTFTLEAPLIKQRSRPE
ncbi:MAG TPA: HAMP domain-containing sensor histidine kinase [Flavitalea sp.]|nr:HAMP domain-containing sensor histidine kinase [Flavitalea sp.]